MKTPPPILFVLIAGTLSSPSSAQCNFTEPSLFSVGSLSWGIAAGDLDNDGDIDLVTDSNTGASNDPLRIHWNDGNGGFATTTTVPAGDGPGNIVLADYDADGDLDIFHANYFSNDVYLIPNNGSGFGAPTSYSMGGGCEAVALGDIDGDGDLDLVGTDQFGGRIRSWRNINGQGFSSIGLFAAGPDAFDLALGDVDGDGDLDAVVTNETSSSIHLLFNDGTGRFPSRQQIGVGERPTGVLVADLNGDGHPDIVTADWGSLFPIQNTISVLMGTGGGAFAPRETLRVHGRPVSVRAADFDGDGVPDLAVACAADDGVAVLRGVGDGTFEPHQLFDIGVEPTRLAVADLDGDARPDLATPGAWIGNICGTPVEPPAVTALWSRTYDNFFNEDVPTHIAATPDGGVVSAGTTAFSENKEDFQVVKHDANGNLEWTYTYNGTGDHYDEPQAMIAHTDGSIYVSGRSWGPSFGIQWAVIKLDADGNELWSRRYDAGNPTAQQNPLAMAVGPDGRIAITGWARGPDNVVGFMVAAWDAAGNFLWQTRLPSPAEFSGVGQAMDFGDDGLLAVTGQVPDQDESGSEMLTAVIDANGQIVWSRRFDGTTDPVFNNTTGQAVRMLPGGEVIAAASATVADPDFWILRYDAAGEELWGRRIDRPTSDYPKAVHPRADGGFLITGSSNLGVLAAAVDADGVELWNVAVPGRVTNDNPTGHVAMSGDGVAWIVGSIGTDFSLTRIDTAGTVLSSTRVDSGEASDIGVAVAAGPDGSVLMLGQVQPSILNRRDFAVVRVEPAEAGCPADLTGDGQLNFFDISLFMDLFNTADPAADLAAPAGVFNFFDVAAYLDRFNAGCSPQGD